MPTLSKQRWEEEYAVSNSVELSARVYPEGRAGTNPRALWFFTADAA
ncbi:hypothetical protein AOX55_00001529 [Sinorhizobium fredii CCBAU 25509]|nr:hypothetical protein AOX55_00001529 [Sinorhizobium fredii CCBAU 25509]